MPPFLLGSLLLMSRVPSALPQPLGLIMGTLSVAPPSPLFLRVLVGPWMCGAWCSHGHAWFCLNVMPGLSLHLLRRHLNPQRSVPRLNVYRTGDLMNYHCLLLRGFAGLMALMDLGLLHEVNSVEVMSKEVAANVLMGPITN